MQIHNPGERRSSMRTALPLSVLIVLALCSVACSAGAPTTTSPNPVRFVVQADAHDPGPVYVQLNTESRPVGWLTLLLDGDPILFAPRCEVPTCGEAGEAVCGAAMPRVSDLAASADSVEYLWDAHVSRTTDEGCEVREPAPAGEYTARICYARSMRGFGAAGPGGSGTGGSGPGGSGPGGAELGRVEDPVCLDRPLSFTGGTGAEVGSGTGDSAGADVMRVTVPRP